MTFGENLRVAWLVFWRLSVLNRIAGYLIKRSLELFWGSPDTATYDCFPNTELAWHLTLFVGISAILSTVFAVFVSAPLVVHMMMRKEFKGSHLEVVRSETQDPKPIELHLRPKDCRDRRGDGAGPRLQR